MAQISYRGNLSSSVFPLTLAKAGRTVITPEMDQNFDRRVDPSGNQKDAGIPQAIYLENVLPNPNGYQSVGFVETADIIEISEDTINVVVQSKIATVVTTTTAPSTVDYTDAGDQIETWEKTADFIANNFVYPITPDDTVVLTNNSTGMMFAWESAVEGNPLPSYGLGAVTMPSYAATFVPHIRKNVQTANASSITLAVQIYFTQAASTDAGSTLVPNKQITIGIGNNVAGAGLKVWYDSSVGANGTLFVGTGTGWTNTGLVTASSGLLSAALAYNTWYIINITVTVNGDGTIALGATLTTTVPVTRASASGVISGQSPVGNYLGFHTQPASGDFNPSSLGGGSTIDVEPNRVYIDNINLDATIPNPSVSTKFSGIINFAVAFSSGNLATWTRINPSMSENNTVTVPGDFVSPEYAFRVSSAFVRGESYMCIIDDTGEARIYSLTYSAEIITYTDITTTILAGMGGNYVATDIVGIVGSYNYLIILTATTVFWSSTTTPTDFAASLVSGAGSEFPNNAKGDIVFAKEHLTGFFIYTTGNIISVTYTGNARYPWKFREIANSGGYEYSNQVSGDTNTGTHIGVNNAKTIQSIGQEVAENIAGEVSDFLERVRYFDEFDYSTNVFTLTVDTDTVIPDSQEITYRGTIFYFLDRYVIVPYGSPIVEIAENNDPLYQYALVFDTLLNRYGKIKIDFHWILHNEENIFFVNRSGVVNYLIFSQDTQGSTGNGVLVLGKFQYIRKNWINLEEIELESSLDVPVQIPELNRNLSCIVLPSLDGKNFSTPVTPYEVPESTGNLVAYLTHVSAKNFALAIKGTFDLNTVALVGHVGGEF